MEEKKEKGVVAKAFDAVVDGFAESTRQAHKISKANLEAEKQAYKKRHAEATAPDPGLEKVKAAKGVKAKTKQVFENMKDGCKEAPENERKRRAEHEKQMAAVNPYIRTKLKLEEEGKL